MRGCAVNLADALKIALDAYDEDAAECEAILDKLAPILLVDRALLKRAIEAAWSVPGYAAEICAALAEYQEERTRIDAEAGGDS